MLRSRAVSLPGADSPLELKHELLYDLEDVLTGEERFTSVLEVQATP